MTSLTIVCACVVMFSNALALDARYDKLVARYIDAATVNGSRTTESTSSSTSRVNSAEPRVIYQRSVSKWLTSGNSYAGETTRWMSRDSEIEADSPGRGVRIVWDGKRLTELHTSEEKPDRNTVVVSDDPLDAAASRASGASDAVLDGFLGGERTPLTLVLSSAERADVSAAIARSDGVDRPLLQATHPTGKYSVTLDPEHGYLPMRVHVVKSGENELNGVKISELFKAHVDAAARPALVLVTLDLHDVEFKEIDGRWLPMSGVCESTYEYADGSQETERLEVIRSSVKGGEGLPRDGFVHSIPNGTPVRFRHPPDAVPRQWQDGEIVPRVNQQELDAIRHNLDHGTR